MKLATINKITLDYVTKRRNTYNLQVVLWEGKLKLTVIILLKYNINNVNQLNINNFIGQLKWINNNITTL